ncbi:hypothetical protein MTBUT4_380025 [Magnetospirillum sp. UT-4]|nr:hypothetical protein MTBUT4_380025 [Magnetospirillum sp. UT-4]
MRQEVTLARTAFASLLRCAPVCFQHPEGTGVFGFARGRSGVRRPRPAAGFRGLLQAIDRAGLSASDWGLPLRCRAPARSARCLVVAGVGLQAIERAAFPAMHAPREDGAGAAWDRSPVFRKPLISFCSAVSRRNAPVSRKPLFFLNNPMLRCVPIDTTYLLPGARPCCGGAPCASVDTGRSAGANKKWG